MARRPRMSPEAKAAKKEQKEAANAQNLAADALLCFPRDLEKQREEFVDVLDQLTSAAKSAAGDVGAHRKRLIELYQIEPWVLTALKSIRKLGPGRKERAIRQFTYLVKQFGLDAQLDLFNETAAPGGATPEEASAGSVFDASKSGETVGAERGDDPGRAQKRKGPPAPSAAATPNVGVEGLAAGIKPLSPKDEAKAAARKKADKYFEPQGDKGLGEGGYH